MWDPIQTRESFERSSGYRRFLSKDVQDIRKRNVLYANGDTAIGDACGCYFCGLDEPARRLAAFGEKLLMECFSSGQIEGHNDLNRGHAYRSLALSRWLLYGEQDADSLAASLEHYKRDDALGRRPDGHILDSYLPTYLNAGDPAYVCKRFEKYSKSSAPENLNSISSSRVASYVIARHKLGMDHYTDDQVMGGVKKFFDRKLDEDFFRRGQYLRIAIWFKIVYWNDARDRPNPRDVLRKAYDHLPSVKSPF